MRFPLVDNKPGSNTRLVSISQNITIYLLPLLDQLLDCDEWIQIGNCPSSVVKQAIESLEVQLFESAVGTVIATLGSIPDNALPCDGQYYDRADYPLLYSALPGRMKDLAGFWTPYLDQRTLVGGSDRGSTGGEESHTLTLDEMPSHTHTVHTHIPGEGVGELATPIPDIGLPAESGVTGLGLPHNNMPPFLVVTFYIIAK